MSRLEELIAKLCPEGVEHKTLNEVATIIRGVRVVRKQLAATGKYPVYQNSLIPMGYYDECNCSANTVFIICAGAAGEIGYSTVNFWAADDCFWFDCSEILLSRYLYHVLFQQQSYILSKVRKASIPRLPRQAVETLKVPIPPLPVQSEIVRILDNFTELTAELTVKLTEELTARKTQYKFYRDKLLSFDILMSGTNSCEWWTLGEISTYRRGSFPQPYGKEEWYDGAGAMPFVQVADIGDDMRLVRNTKRKISVVAQPKSVFAPQNSIIISLQGSIGKIAITQYDAYIDRTVAIFQDISEKIVPKYFAYQLQQIFSIKEKTARGSTIKTITKEEFTNFSIPVPSIVTQQRIVNVLESFDTRCNDLTAGLSAEIETRQRQYEYYRNKLLSFPEK